MAMATDGKEDVFSIDSKPVKVCQNAKAKRCAMGKDDWERAPTMGLLRVARHALLWI